VELDSAGLGHGPVTISCEHVINLRLLLKAGYYLSSWASTASDSEGWLCSMEWVKFKHYKRPSLRTCQVHQVDALTNFYFHGLGTERRLWVDGSPACRPILGRSLLPFLARRPIMLTEVLVVFLSRSKQCCLCPQLYHALVHNYPSTRGQAYMTCVVVKASLIN
jgi:hypothetical protein